MHTSKMDVNVLIGVHYNILKCTLLLCCASAIHYYTIDQHIEYNSRSAFHWCLECGPFRSVARSVVFNKTVDEVTFIGMECYCDFHVFSFLVYFVRWL